MQQSANLKSLDIAILTFLFQIIHLNNQSSPITKRGFSIKIERFLKCNYEKTKKEIICNEFSLNF
jgi:hypothetical protein